VGNYGVYILSSGSNVTAENGAINITGVGAGSGSANHGVYYGVNNAVTSSGSGAITIHATAAGAAVDFISGGAYTLGGALATGNITFNANTATWGGLIINTSGTVTFAPRTASSVGVAGGAGGLQVTTALLNAMLRASGVIINNAVGAGYITVAPYTWARDLTLISGSGDINFTAGTTDMGGFDLSATSTTGNVIFATVNNASSILAHAQGASGNITLNGVLTATGTNTAILLAAGNDFINNAGVSALVTPSGRWLVYSTNPADNTLGGLTSTFHRYSCTYGGSCPTFPASGNGLLYTVTPLLTITPNGVVLNYGTAASLAGYGYSVAGYLGSDSSLDTLSGSLTGTSAYGAGSNIGTYGISYGSGSLASALGYGFTYANNATAITVNPLTITANFSGPINMVYNGSTLVNLTPANFTLTGLFGGDAVAVAATTGNYASANVGTGIVVNVSGLTLTGAAAGNYTLASTSLASAVGVITEVAAPAPTIPNTVNVVSQTTPLGSGAAGIEISIGSISTSYLLEYLTAPVPVFDERERRKIFPQTGVIEI
jgi:hypothetical protein